MDSATLDEALVVFTPSGKRGRFPVGTPLLHAARALGVDIDGVCGGRAICGRCQVRVASGEFAKHGLRSSIDHLSARTATEERFEKKKGLAVDRRLSCQSKLIGDVVIDVPAESQVHRQVVRKRAEVRDIELDPAITLHYLDVAEPDMHDARGDFERVREALETQWGIYDVDIDLRSLQELQWKLREGQWKIMVAIHQGRRVIAVRPGFFEKSVFGIAIDIGSTTVAGHLCDLRSGAVLASSGIMNPQIRFGEDLMSRVSYSMMHSGGHEEMTLVLREALTAMVGQLAAEAMIDPNDILELVLVGNPIMHHLLLGVDPVELGGAPFALATDSAIELWANEIKVTSVNDSARVYILPCIAGHVGADAAGVVLSETPYLNDETTLVVDVGTNAEIVLGNKERVLACSSPTGPAFEGAQISSGQRAAPGAIERVRIDRDTLEPRFKVIGCDLWSDAPGFEEAVLRTGVTGICGSGIIEALAEMYLSGIISSDGVIDGALAENSARIVAEGRTFSYVLRDGSPVVKVTQNDVRAIQLAKAALYAGAKLLMDEMGVETVERVTLAGAFGSHIDPLYAMVIGLIPDCPLDKVVAAGNAAGTGARIALLNKSRRREIEQVVRTISKIETAVAPKFQEHFVEAMAFPHKSQPTPNLAQVVALPEPKRLAEPAGGEEGGRRRRRRR